MIDIAFDVVTSQRIAVALVAVQLTVPAADLDYVRAGAVMVGLNRLYDHNYRFMAADFTSPGQAAFVEAVTIDSTDLARATSLAAELSVPIANIYSAALCTGAAKLAGEKARIVGPFSDTV